MYLGFVVFIVGWIFQTTQIGAQLPYAPQYYYSKSNKYGRVFFWVFNLFPWNPLTKGIIDLGAATASASAPGLRWSQRYSYCRYVPVAEDQEPYDTRSEFRDYACIYPIGQVRLRVDLCLQRRRCLRQRRRAVELLAAPLLVLGVAALHP